MKYLLLLVALSATVACSNAPIRGSIDSGANRLNLGMTLPQVESIVGPAAFRTPEGKVTCTSHGYDETIKEKFIHARFENAKLISASDNHRNPC